MEGKKNKGYTPQPLLIATPFRIQKQLYCHIEQSEIGTLAVDVWAVTFGTGRTRLSGAAARPSPSSLY